MMSLCVDCICIGYCIKRSVKLVSNQELANPDFLRDIRRFALSLDIPYTQWLEYLSDTYRDYPGWVVGPDNQEVMLDMEVFETPGIDYWFRHFCCTPLAEGATPYIKDVAIERVRVLATILRASNPKAALMWGVRAANDNEKEG